MIHDGWKPGAPELDSPWRCNFVLTSGRRCRSWSLATPETTKLHPATGQRKPLGLCRIHNRWADSDHLWGLQDVPRYYRRSLGPTLKAAVEEALAVPAAEQVELNEELALMREAASEAVKTFSDAVEFVRVAEATGRPEYIEPAREALQGASHLVMGSLERVGDYSLKLARVEALSKDNITIHTVYSVLSQVTRIFYVVCGEENEALAREVERRIRDEVNVPGIASNDGTDITPGDDIKAMDSTVPREPTE